MKTQAELLEPVLAELATKAKTAQEARQDLLVAVLAAQQAGATLEEIGDAIGRTKQAVSQALNRSRKVKTRVRGV